MLFLIAFTPVAVALFTLGCLSWSGRKAGMATLGVAILLVLSCTSFYLPVGRLSMALVEGTPTIVVVLFVLYAGLLLYHLQQKAGALDAIAQGIVRISPDRGVQILILVLGVAPAIESVSGFGVGTVVVIPVLLALRLPPFKAALLGLLSQVAIPWGALAVGTTYAAELTNLEASGTGARTALLSAPLPTLYGLVALYVAGGWPEVRRHWLTALVVGSSLSVCLWLFSRTTGVELAGFLASLVSILLLLARQCFAASDALTPETTAVPAEASKQEPTGAATLGWQRAVLPYLVLLGLLLCTRLATPVQQWLQQYGTIEVPGTALRYPLLSTAGFWVFLSAVAAPVLLGLRFRDFAMAAWQAGRQIVPGAVAIICFLETAQIMRLSGMAAALGVALASLGNGFCWASPWLGAVGGWLTGSNTGSNALFALLQKEAAVNTGLSPEWLVAGQNAAGSHSAMISPARTVPAATGAGLSQSESSLLWSLGPVILVAEVIIMLCLLVASHG